MRGILFKPDMIKAIVEGRKTQTRRLDGLKEINLEPDKWWCKGQDKFQDWLNKTAFIFGQINTTGERIIKSRYQVGEVVYIKEAYKVIDFDLRDIDKDFQRTRVEYKLDGETAWVMKPKDKLITIPDKWHSPLFMPAWAARYFIKITDVKAQRLQEISFNDCLAEGIVHAKEWQTVDYKAPEPLHPNDLSNEEADKEIERGWIEYAKQSYAKLWDSINPKYPFVSNPWLWRYKFKKVKRPCV